MSPAALCKLRLLASARFDSQPLLCVVLAGDARLIEKLRRPRGADPAGQPHPHAAGHRARQPRRTHRGPGASVGRRRQCRPDDPAAAPHAVRSRRRATTASSPRWPPNCWPLPRFRCMRIGCERAGAVRRHGGQRSCAKRTGTVGLPPASPRAVTTGDPSFPLWGDCGHLSNVRRFVRAKARTARRGHPG